jgi:hypothetical protein
VAFLNLINIICLDHLSDVVKGQNSLYSKSKILKKIEMYILYFFIIVRGLWWGLFWLGGCGGFVVVL